MVAIIRRHVKEIKEAIFTTAVSSSDLKQYICVVLYISIL